MYITLRKPYLFFVLFCLFAIDSYSVTKTWLGTSTSTTWGTASNWNPSGVPVAGDDIVFDNTSLNNCILPATGPLPTFSSFTIQTTNTRTISMSAGVGLTISGAFNMGGGTFNCSSGALSAGAYTQNGGGSFVGSTGSITFASYTQNAGSFNGSSAGITINGAYALNTGTFTSTSATLSVSGNFSVFGTAVFNHNNGTVNLNGSAAQTIQISNSPVSSLYSLQLSGATASTITMASPLTLAGSLNIGTGKTLTTAVGNYQISVAGNWTNSGTFTPNSGLVVFNGTTQAINNGASNFNNIQFSAPAGTTTLGAALRVNGNVTINAGETLDVSASNYQINAGGNWTNSGTFTPRSGLVVFNGTTQTINNGTSSFSSVQLSAPAGTTTLAANTTLTGALTIDTGETLDISASSYQLNVAGNWTNNGTFTQRSGLVVFNGTSQTINNGASNNFNNVQFSAPAGTSTLAANMRVNGNLTINTGETLDASATNYQINVGGNWTNSGTFTPRGGLVVFNGTTQTVNNGASTFNSVQLSAPAGTTTLAANTTLSGALTIDTGETLDISVSNYQLNVAGNWTNNGTFTQRSGLVVFNGVSQTINNGTSNNFNNVQFSAPAGTSTLGANMRVNGNLTINTGETLDVSATSYQINVGGNWTNSGAFTGRSGLVVFNGTTQTINNGTSSFGSVQLSAPAGTSTLAANTTLTGNLTIDAGEVLDISASNYQLNVGGNWTNNGTFTQRSGLVVFNGTTQTINNGTGSFNNVQFSAPAGTSTLGANTTINGNLTIDTGDILAGSTFQLTLLGNWTGNGTYAPNTSLVVFAGSSAQTLAGTGTQNFYGMKINNPSGLTLSAAANVANALTLTSGNINTTSTNILQLGTAASATSGSSGSFVSGPMQKVGNTAFTFPVGKSGVYAPVAVSYTTGTTADNFQAEYFPAAPSIIAFTAPLKDLSNCEYWNMQHVAGTGSAQVTLNWSALTCTPVHVSASAVALRGTTSWSNAGNLNQTGTDVAGSVTSNAATTFGDVTFGYLSVVVLDTREMNQTTFSVSNSELSGASLLSGTSGTAAGTRTVVSNNASNNVPGVVVFHPTYPSTTIDLGIIASASNAAATIRLSTDASANLVAVKGLFEGNQYFDMSTDYYNISGSNLVFHKQKAGPTYLNITTNLINGLVFDHSVNTTFQVTVPGFTNVVLKVFDKTGTQIYSGTANTWDGKPNLPSPSGSYVASGAYQFQVVINGSNTYSGQLLFR